MHRDDLEESYEGKSRFYSRGNGRRKHGLSKTKEYDAWCHMKSRCYSESYYLFKEYGGRGVTVCERWISSFENFIADVGMAPSASHTLDRIDSNGKYEPSNVRWADWKTQQRNRRNNRLVEISGESKTLAEWCEIYGANYGNVWQRISKLGMDPLFALTAPKQKGGPKNGRV